MDTLNIYFYKILVAKSSLARTPYSPITDYSGCQIEFVILYHTLIDSWFFFSDNLDHFVKVVITFSTLDFLFLVLRRPSYAHSMAMYPCLNLIFEMVLDSKQSLACAEYVL